MKNILLFICLFVFWVRSPAQAVDSTFDVLSMGIDINEVSIETASLAPGVYTITLFREKSLYIGKLVVLER